jgi:hypothetical protein
MRLGVGVVNLRFTDGMEDMRFECEIEGAASLASFAASTVVRAPTGRVYRRRPVGRG